MEKKKSANKKSNKQVTKKNVKSDTKKNQKQKVKSKRNIKPIKKKSCKLKTKKTQNQNLKKSFKKLVSNLFKKKSKKNKDKKKTLKKSINFKEELNNIRSHFLKSLNKKIETKKNNKLTKEMYILIFIIAEIIIFNFALLASRIISFEYYNSIEFLALVFLNPFILITEGMIYGIRFGFSYIVAILLSCVFILSVMIFLKIEFVFYVPIYFIFVLSSEICAIALNRVKRI